jgi:hypothetical protein
MLLMSFMVRPPLPALPIRTVALAAVVVAPGI